MRQPLHDSVDHGLHHSIAVRETPVNRQPWIRKTAGTLLCASVVAMVGCNSNQPSSPAQPAASSSTAAPAATPYTSPSADQLYQLVAPIALFPDKLIAQVLAGSTYPDQIARADNVLVQNPNLKGADLQTAIAQQPWDPSVKGLTAFPSVLDQMARNIDWTTALGEAYVNDPTDVMNAIQVMRRRATQHGSLRSSAQMRVVTQAEPVQPVDNVSGDNSYPVYNGPAVVPAPEQIIEIQPAQPDTVYVPQYDAQTVYGEELPSYPGYVYERPREYSTGQMVTVGAVSFGVGILVGALLEHHHDEARSNYGWQSWGMNWGARGRDGERGGHYGDWQRPAVIHNNNTYISRSTTVVNHYVTNNINNSRNVIYNHSNVNSNNQRNTTINNNQHNDNRRIDNRRIDNRGEANAQAFAMKPGEPRAAIARTPAQVAHKPMSMPDFGARGGHVSGPRSDAVATRPAESSARQRAIAPRPEAARLPTTRGSYDMRPAVTTAHARPVTGPTRGHLQPMPRVVNSHTSVPVAPREPPVRHTAPRAMPEATHSLPRAPQRPAPVMERPHPAAQSFRAEPRPEPVRPVVREQAAPVRHENARPSARPQPQRKAEPHGKDDRKDDHGH